MKAFINCVSYYLPEKVISNEKLVEDFPEWSVDKVAEKLGVKQRHICDESQTAGDMAIKAARNLFRENGINTATIDFILFCTQSPDYYLPTTACLIQKELGISTGAGALDFNLGCSGYIYGLSLAKGLIYAGIAKNILLLTSETYSKYIHSKDKSNRSIFGDAASATLVSITGILEICEFVLGTDGHGGDNLIVRTGCARNPNRMNIIDFDDAGTMRSSDHLYMNGSEIFNFTIKFIPPLISNTLSKNNLKKEEIDLFIFHQANKFMLNTLRQISQIEESRFYIQMEDVGNTVSSTIPIALARLIKKNEIKKNFNILIAGFGVGYSWGACTLKS